MPITDAFTLVAAVAMLGLAYISREFWLNHQAIIAGKRNGLRLEVSRMLVALVFTLTSTNILLVLAGIGILLHVRYFGYLLAVIPIFKLFCAWYVLRSLRRQARLVAEQYPTPPEIPVNPVV